MLCQADARQAAKAAADALALDDRVLGTDVLPPTRDPTACWTVEIALDRAAGGLPPGLAAELATRGLTVRAVRPRGRLFNVVATV